MQQLDLVDYMAARAHGPRTSIDADRMLRLSGKRATRQHYVLHCVLSDPGLTSNDYFYRYLKALFPKTDYAAWSSRFTECRNAGLIYSKDSKVSEHSKASGITWHPEKHLFEYMSNIHEHITQDIRARSSADEFSN